MEQVHHVPELPGHMERFDGTELARGCFEEIACVQGGLVVSGWMLLPDKDFSSLRVYWNGEPAGPADAANGRT